MEGISIYPQEGIAYQYHMQLLGKLLVLGAHLTHPAMILLPSCQPSSEICTKQMNLWPLLHCFGHAAPTDLPCSSSIATSRATIPPRDWLALQIVLLVLPGDKGSVLLDTAGEAALAVLRTMGLPGLMVAVQGSKEASLKERAAAKKLGEAAVSSQVGSACSQISVCLWHGKCFPDAQLDILTHTPPARRDALDMANNSLSKSACNSMEPAW